MFLVNTFLLIDVAKIHTFTRCNLTKKGKKKGRQQGAPKSLQYEKTNVFSFDVLAELWVRWCNNFNLSARHINRNRTPHAVGEKVGHRGRRRLV